MRTDQDLFSKDENNQELLSKDDNRSRFVF